MASLSNKSIFHFTHPGHPLTAVNTDHEHEYICDGCKTPGTGKRYRCENGCNFDLHEYCGTCPRVLYSFMHKDHELTLVTHARPQATRACKVCLDHIEGFFYRYEDCNFNAHPLCTQLPEESHHESQPLARRGYSVLDQVQGIHLQRLPPYGICSCVCGSGYYHPLDLVL